MKLKLNFNRINFGVLILWFVLLLFLFAVMD